MPKGSGKDEKKLFKEYFDAQLLLATASRLKQHSGNFDEQAFVSTASDGLDRLEMMDRVRQIADAMDQALPGTTRDRMDTLIRAMGPALDSDEDIMGSGYMYWPWGEFIGTVGLDDWDASFDAMTELTQRLTSEFAIRPFLAADARRCLKMLAPLVTHENEHVRRWVSEGLRTRLPWAKKVPALDDLASERVELLAQLRADESLYVRRSVANHLQDIIKDDAKIGFAVLGEWIEDDREHVQWVCRHAARGALKQGSPDALALFGYKPNLVNVSAFRACAEGYRLGDTLELRASIGNPTAASLPVRVDWVLDRPTSAGNRSEKVFRWKDVELAMGETCTLSHRFALVHRSTRRLADGTHNVFLRVNGVDAARCQFRLTT